MNIYCLGLLFAAVGAASAAQYKYDITLDDIRFWRKMPDGDRIVLKTEKLSCIGEDQVAISIKSKHLIFNNWKSIRLHQKPRHKKYRSLIDHVDRSDYSQTAIFNLKELETNDLLIWKSTTIIGRKRIVYRISDALKEMEGGHKYTLVWWKE